MFPQIQSIQVFGMISDLPRSNQDWTPGPVFQGDIYIYISSSYVFTETIHLPDVRTNPAWHKPQNLRVEVDRTPLSSFGFK